MLKYMDDQKQLIKTCRPCGHEREYDNCHRLHVARKNVLVYGVLNITKKWRTNTRKV